MSGPTPHSTSARAQAPLRPSTRGAALITALLLLVAVLIIGVSAAGIALNAEKAARHERDRHLALQAAEAGLLDAEHDIEGGSDRASARAALFAEGSAVGFEEGCGRGADSANLGLCARALPHLAPAWQTCDLSSARDDAVPYGKFTGAIMPAGVGSLPARTPRYIIELMPLVRAGEDAGQRAGNLYRITAIGYGTRETTHVVLQSFYRKVGATGGPL